MYVIKIIQYLQVSPYLQLGELNTLILQSDMIHFPLSKLDLPPNRTYNMEL